LLKEDGLVDDREHLDDLDIGLAAHDIFSDPTEQFAPHPSSSTTEEAS
jgi:hypothetical protein